MAGAAHALRDGGALVTYGPFKLDGAFTSDSNAAFDTSLRARNPEWRAPPACATCPPTPRVRELRGLAGLFCV